MYTDKEILEIIHNKIKTDEKLGEQTGGSGHLGYVSYEFKSYSTKQLTPERLEIIYTYSTFVETEFTYYPDNPPMEYEHTKRIVVDSKKRIIDEN